MIPLASLLYVCDDIGYAKLCFCTLVLLFQTRLRVALSLPTIPFVAPGKVCGMCGILMDSSYPVGVRVSSAVSTGSAARKLHGTSPYA